MTHKFISTPRWTAVIILAALVYTSNPVAAEMYKWVDDEGRTHYTDNLFNIPKENLPEVRTYEELDDGSTAGEITLKKLGSGYVAEVQLNALHSVNLVVDTGASITLISPAALEEAGIILYKGRSVKIRTANGEATAQLAKVDSITVGDFKRGPFDVVAHDAKLDDADGLLGMDFLGAYRVEILSLGPTLRLSPQ